MSEAVRNRFVCGKLFRVRDPFGIRYHSDVAYRARVDERRTQRERLIQRVFNRCIEQRDSAILSHLITFYPVNPKGTLREDS